MRHAEADFSTVFLNCNTSTLPGVALCIHNMWTPDLNAINREKYVKAEVSQSSEK